MITTYQIREVEAYFYGRNMTAMRVALMASEHADHAFQFARELTANIETQAEADELYAQAAGRWEAVSEVWKVKRGAFTREICDGPDFAIYETAIKRTASGKIRRQRRPLLKWHARALVLTRNTMGENGWPMKTEILDCVAVPAGEGSEE